MLSSWDVKIWDVWWLIQHHWTFKIPPWDGNGFGTHLDPKVGWFFSQMDLEQIRCKKNAQRVNLLRKVAVWRSGWERVAYIQQPKATIATKRDEDLISWSRHVTGIRAPPKWTESLRNQGFWADVKIVRGSIPSVKKLKPWVWQDSFLFIPHRDGRQLRPTVSLAGRNHIGNHQLAWGPVAMGAWERPDAQASFRCLVGWQSPLADPGKSWKTFAIQRHHLHLTWGKGYPKMASFMAKFHGKNDGQPLKSPWILRPCGLLRRPGGHFQHMGSRNHFLDSHHAGRLSPLDQWPKFPGACHLCHWNWRKKRYGIPNFKASYRGFSELFESPIWARKTWSRFAKQIG